MLSVRSGTAAGVHVSGRSIRVVELSRKRRKTIVTGLGFGEVSCRTDAVSLADPAVRSEVAGAIERLRGEASLNLHSPVLCVDDSTLLFKRFPLDSVLKKLGAEQVTWEMSQVLSEPDDYAIDYYMDADAGYGVAVRRLIVESYLDIGHRAGFKPVAVDVQPFALCNAYQMLLRDKRREVAGVLSLEEGVTTLMIAKDGGLLSASMVPISRMDRDVVYEEIPDELDEPSHSLVRHIHRQLSETEFVRRGPSFDRLLLCGSLCQSEGLADALAGESRSLPVLADPFHGLELGSRVSDCSDLLSKGHLFVVAIGLACRGLEEQ